LICQSLFTGGAETTVIWSCTAMTVHTARPEPAAASAGRWRGRSLGDLCARARPTILSPGCRTSAHRVLRADQRALTTPGRLRRHRPGYYNWYSLSLRYRVATPMFNDRAVAWRLPALCWRACAIASRSMSARVALRGRTKWSVGVGRNSFS
jgi:hypothetical protein